MNTKYSFNYGKSYLNVFKVTILVSDISNDTYTYTCTSNCK